MFIGNCFLCHSQITVVPQTHTNVTLIGKISHTAAFQTGGLSRALPTSDALKIVGNENIFGSQFHPEILDLDLISFNLFYIYYC